MSATPRKRRQSGDSRIVGPGQKPTSAGLALAEHADAPFRLRLRR